MHWACILADPPKKIVNSYKIALNGVIGLGKMFNLARIVCCCGKSIKKLVKRSCNLWEIEYIKVINNLFIGECNITVTIWCKMISWKLKGNLWNDIILVFGSNKV